MRWNVSGPAFVVLLAWRRMLADETRPTEEIAKSFRFWMPLEPLAKSAFDGSATADRRLLQGIASTEETDAQNERVLQDGIDSSPLTKSGFVNWNHQPGPENLIGQPLEVKIVRDAKNRPALFVKAELFKDIPRADAAWALATNLAKANADGTSDRRLGWSVEGGVVERRGNVIARSVVRQIALTHEPVAYGTFAELAKSMLAKGDGATSSIASAPAVMLQNLAGTKRSVKDICQMLYGEKADKCQRSYGQFAKGRAGMLEHLITCEGWAAKEAYDFCLGLFRNATA